MDRCIDIFTHTCTRSFPDDIYVETARLVGILLFCWWSSLGTSEKPHQVTWQVEAMASDGKAHTQTAVLLGCGYKVGSCAAAPKKCMHLGASMSCLVGLRMYCDYLLAC